MPKNNGKKVTAAQLWIIAIGLFALSFVVRLFLNYWTGPVVTQIAYPDEVRFFHIAASLAESGEILVRGAHYNYQKILYPLSLTPAFLLSDDQITQVNIIRALNCLFVSSTVFPALMLAKKLTSNRVVIVLSLLITVTLPDLAYSATLSAETLNMPLVIWLFLLAYKAMSEQSQPKRLVTFGALGFVIYLVYLNKEVGAAFLVATVLLLAIEALRDRKRLMSSALSALALLAAFFVPLLIMSQTVFSGMIHTYATATHNQIALAALSSPSVFLYMIYSAVVFFIAAILSFYAAPAFISLYGYGAMDENKKKLLLFASFSFLIMVGAVAYTISIREDLGELVPRLHMRFIAPFVLPLVILCLDSLFSETAFRNSKRFTRVFVACLAVFCVAAMILIPHGHGEDVFYDHFTLRSGLGIGALMAYIGGIPVDILLILFKLALVALTVYGAIVVTKGSLQNKQGIFVALLLCTIFTVNLYDNFMDYTSIRRSKTVEFSPIDADPDVNYLEFAFCEDGLRISRELVDSTIAVNGFLKSLDGSKIAFVERFANSFTDTYLDQRVFPVNAYHMWTIAESNGGWVRIDEQPIHEGRRLGIRFMDLDTWVADIMRVDYIVTMAYEHPFYNVEKLFESYPYVVLRNLDPDVVFIELR